MFIQRTYKMFILFLCFMFFTSCSTFDASLDSLLVPPKTNDVLIKGTWQVEKFYYVYKNFVSTNSNIDIGDFLFFSDNYLNINGEFIDYTEYKIKSTTLKDYMRIRFKAKDIDFLDIKDKDINAFTVKDLDGNVYEFLIYDERTILFYNDDNKIYVLKKISDVIDKEFEAKVKEECENNSDGNLILSLQNTGFLISFRSERHLKDLPIPQNSYKTIWFYQDKDGKISYKLFDDIIVVKDGRLLKVKVKVSSKNNLYEKIVIEELNNNENEKNKTELVQNEEFINQFIDINYINENYIGINYNQSTDYLGDVSTDSIAVVPIDSPYIESRLNFSDLFHDKEEHFYRSRNEFLTIMGEDVLSFYDKDVREDSFMISRHPGGWFLSGRINSRIGYDKIPLDFDINLLPDDSIVKYNDLFVSFNKIKQKQPEAIDGFTSPDGSIVVILTKDTLYFYNFMSDKISHAPIGEFSLDLGDKVIASNWFLGEQADRINKFMIG